MRILILVVAALLLAGHAHAQSLPHERYTLDNGLTVILHEDHSLPVGSINLWYRVGARNEPPGRSGFAHLFEHLMFMGTSRVPGSGFDDLMEEGGGSNNATTSLDRTNYFSNGPASLLPTLLWLDADRLEDLGSFMNQEKLDLQRDVVRNERRQTVENAPYGKAYEATYQLMYPPSHPYHNGVIGTHADLEAATVQDVKDFFATFYSPENVSLVVAGDFNPAHVKPLIADLFGSIPRGNAASPAAVPPARMDRVLRMTSLDKVRLPKVSMNYHSPGQYADGDAEMLILAEILAGGENSRLYSRLVTREGLAVAVEAMQDQAALGSVFRIEVLANPGTDLSRIEAIMDEEINRLAEDGPTEEEVRRRSNTIELNLLSDLQSVAARADRLNEYLYFWGEPDSLQRDLDRFRTATADRVREWARHVLTPGARLIMRVLPEDVDGRPASPRDSRPADGSPDPFSPPLPDTRTLSNGIPVHVWKKPGLPLATVSLVMLPEGGAVDPSRPGLSSLVAEMTTQGAGDLDAEGFQGALQDLGAMLHAGVDAESIQMTLTLLPRHIEKGIGLLASASRHPRLDASDFDRVRTVAMSQLEQRREQPAIVAADVASRMLFNDASPYAWPVDGTRQSLSTITLADITKYHEAVFNPRRAHLLVCGDIEPSLVLAILQQAFGGWETPPDSGDSRPIAAGLRAEPGAKGMRVYLVDRPNAVQTAIHLATPAAGFASAQRVPAELANIVLGGTFTSRLNRNLRETHGYTYGARSRLWSRAAIGVCRASTAVRADVTGPALREFLGEIARMGSGDLASEELAKARETARYMAAAGFSTIGDIVSTGRDLLAKGAGFDQVGRDLEAVASADIEAVRAGARSLSILDRSVLVLVGDRSLILEQIADLGLPPVVVVDADARPQ